MKDARWKQETPIDQFVAIRMAMEGTLSNFQDKIIEREKFILFMDDYLQQLFNLKPFLEHNRW